jgi:uncharacterized membrane protein YhhN
MRKSKVISLIYFLTGILYIILQAESVVVPGIITKALIIPLLMILLFVNLWPVMTRLHWLMFAGLLFSWAGDVILEFSQNNILIFIAGLVSFLLAHIMYLIVFFRTPGKNIILSRRFYLIIPVIICGSGLLCFLYDDLAEMRLPVIFYTIVILTMLAGAINRKEKVNSQSYYLVLSGAILFVISDSAIAINKFSYPFEFSGIVIMSTYITAQYLIITGYIKQLR